MRFRYAIFDMDGLMFDTETIARQAFIDLGPEYIGQTVTLDHYYQVVGTSEAAIEARFREWFGWDYSYADYRKAIVGRIMDSFHDGDTPMKPGLMELLNWLRAHDFKIAMATSNDMAVAESHLRDAHIEEYFDARIAGDMVSKGKPDPEVFLTAARLLGAEDPGECVVFEDSKNGLIAGCRAGMAVITVPDVIDADAELPGMAYARCETLADAIPVLERS